MERLKKTTWLQLQFSMPKKILLSAGLLFALILFVYHFHIPNPNMILIVGLVLCSALFGFGGGIVAAVIMLGYTLFFFSTDHSFTRFTPQNLQKVGVSLVGVTADMLLVCFLKRAELQAFRRIDALTEELHRENEKLQHLSLTDPLTGIRNRGALWQDYESFLGHPVTVMMLDLNNFKAINDTRGHEEGDRILIRTARLLADHFGEPHCYRYGGDEFLVIVPDISEEAFQARVEALMRAAKQPGASSSPFSLGYVHAALAESDTLRVLISNADEKMYEAKRDKAQPAVAAAPSLPDIRDSEFTVAEMRAFLTDISRDYALARVVDPVECRILKLGSDGSVGIEDSCYGIWDAEQRCLNCSSATACKTGCCQEKMERFQDQLYSIQSYPVKLRLADGTLCDAVVELANAKPAGGHSGNDRAAENIGTRAAHYRAHHDSLTNVLNADAFYELAREAIRNSPDVRWVMVTGNIMNFRLVNTLFGVQKGNEVLVRTSALLHRIAEQGGGLCGRLGGDQFALLLPLSGYREASLRESARVLAESFNSGIFTFCIHYGVYEIDDPSLPVSVMCGRANSALRTIREDMTHTVARFDGAILQKILLEQTVIGSFDDALREGQFRMYLQPLVNQHGRLFGAEALVRWHRADGTVLMPGDFIETLESVGLIHRLDMYMWELAVRQLSAWKGTEKEALAISVNMSAKDFYSIDVYEVLTDLVDRYGVDSGKLRLEITETALLAEPEKSDAILSRLRGRGFLVEIDDYGKGYSSLSLLKTIRDDVLKIDISLLREIAENERSKLILRSVIDLADSLGMDVIAEGVETEVQFETLLGMGCSHFQGFYFSRPLPLETFESGASSTGAFVPVS